MKFKIIKKYVLFVIFFNSVRLRFYIDYYKFYIVTVLVDNIFNFNSLKKLLRIILKCLIILFSLISSQLINKNFLRIQFTYIIFEY